MGAINFILNKTVIAKRRADWETVASRDALNAPVYGKDITWTTIYPALRCRIEISASTVQFKLTGERVVPTIKMFIDDNITLMPEDRIFDGDDIYIVEGVQTYYNPVGGIHHFEFSLIKP
jgi:hypothetical protein